MEQPQGCRACWHPATRWCTGSEVELSAEALRRFIHGARP